MTFKIDKVGFYKNRKGEKVEITNYRVTHGVWEDSDGNPYNENGYKIFFGEDIIAHWEEPLELEESSAGKAKDKFYLVWDDKAQEPYGMYIDFEEAKTAAQRAAKEYPKETFHVMQAIAAYTVEVEIKEIKL